MVSKTDISHLTDKAKKSLKEKFDKNVADCLVFQDTLISEAAQLEFKAPKGTIKSLTRKQKLKKTRKILLDRYGFESSDRPHIEKWDSNRYCKDGFLVELKKIPVDEIEMKEKGYGWGDTEASQQRRGREYAGLMKKGVYFPPIKVFGKRHKGDTYQVFDGHARLIAHRINNEKFIEAEITLVDEKGSSLRC